MSNEGTVIRVSWVTPAMRGVHAHNYYHQACYTGSSLPAQQICELPDGEIGRTAVCCGCGRAIVPEVEVESLKCFD